MTDVPLVDLEFAPPSVGVASGGIRRLSREILRSGTALAGLFVLLVIAVMAIFAPLIAPHDPTQIDLLHRLAKPGWMGGSWTHPLGTDGLGHDELSLLVYGARVSMTTGVIVILLAGVISYAPDGNRWKVSVYGSNILDKTYTNLRQAISTGTFWSYGDPRTYGVRVEANF